MTSGAAYADGGGETEAERVEHEEGADGPEGARRREASPAVPTDFAARSERKEWSDCLRQ